MFGQFKPRAPLLLSRALERLGLPSELEPLDDTLELLAAGNAAYRHLPRRRFGREIRVLRRLVPEPAAGAR